MTTQTPMGRLLLHRLVLREKLRLQVQFLESLAQIPECQEIALYGGAALHGVYLHGRLSDDLDLIAPHTLARNFPAILAAHGLTLEEREGLVPAYTRPGTLGTAIGIGVDVCARPDANVEYECRPFGFLTGHTVPVRVPPLARMLAEKLDCVTRRARPADFLDLWLGFRHDPALIRETFAALHAGRPRLAYDPAAALGHLASLRDDWQEALRPLMLRAPDHEDVRRDLERGLCGAPA